MRQLQRLDALRALSAAEMLVGNRAPGEIAKVCLWTLMALLAIAVATYAITISVAPATRPPLVQLLFLDYPTAALAHFLGGALALLAGAAQMNSRLRTRVIRLHRALGRVYVLAVLGGGSAGFVLALHSSAGPVARSGFAFLALCWLGTTLTAYFQITRGNLPAHRDWMIRSYALTLAAVTLRLYLPASELAGLPMAQAYRAIAWLSWVPNLLVAEWFVRSRHSAAMLPGAARFTGGRRTEEVA